MSITKLKSKYEHVNFNLWYRHCSHYGEDNENNFKNYNDL